MNLNDIPEPSEEDLSNVREVLELYCDGLEYPEYLRVIAHLIRQGKVLVGLLETVGVTADIWDLTPAEESAIKTFEEIE